MTTEFSFKEVRDKYSKCLIDSIERLLIQIQKSGHDYNLSSLTINYEETIHVSQSELSNIYASQQPENKSGELLRSSLELCLREAFWRFRNSIRTQSLPFECNFLFFDLIQLCADKSICDSSFPLVMIEEFASTSPSKDLQFFVNYLSSRLLIIINNMVPMKGKGLTFLRLCNELQRRCGKLKDSVVSGELRVLLLIAFPLNERSGLNLRGDVDADNAPVYEGMNDEENDLSLNENISAYRQFWKLQSFLANPTLLFVEANFETFQKGIKWSLKKIDKNIRDSRLKYKELRNSHIDKKPRVAEKVGQEVKTTEAINDSSNPREDVNFSWLNARDPSIHYSTKMELLSIQLCDPDFQRSIFVQFLIILQFLQSIPKEGTRLPAAVKPPPEFELTTEQLQWISDTTIDIYAICRDSPFGGERFTRFIKETLRLEPYYSEWKNAGCPGYRRQTGEKLTAAQEAALVKSEQDLIKELNANADKMAKKNEAPLPTNEHLLGTEGLSRLWKLGENNKQFVKQGSLKRGCPTLEEFIEEKAPEAENFEETEDYRRALSWKAFRLAAKSNFDVLSKSSSIDILSLKAAISSAKFIQPNNTAPKVNLPNSEKKSTSDEKS